MEKGQNNQSRKQVLLGFAVDVSGSMEQSIRNQSQKEENRFESFKEALRKLSEETKQEIESCKKEGYNPSINVFAYAFGLSKLDHCDLLSLLKINQKMMPTSKEKIEKKFEDPYEELADISKKYGVKDMEKYTRWGKEILSETEARQLANRLYEYPKIAEQLMSLLPESFSQIEKKIQSDTAIGGFLGGGAIVIGGVVTGGALWLIGAGAATAGAAGSEYAKRKSIEQEKKKLEKPEKLARELAKASDDEIHKIIIREIDSSWLKKELNKQGKTRMPLEEVADLLESNEKKVEDIEPLIYGRTPMTNTLRVVKERFKQELAQLPENTVPVLFILSDGIPTDGDPTPIANALKDEGVYIISCFVTDEDITAPRSLFETVSPQWNQGAKLMFNMASSADKDSRFTGYLSEHGWKIPAKPKLFVQVNHSEVLNEFIQVVLSPLRETK